MSKPEELCRGCNTLKWKCNKLRSQQKWCCPDCECDPAMLAAIEEAFIRLDVRKRAAASKVMVDGVELTLGPSFTDKAAAALGLPEGKAGPRANGVYVTRISSR
jgi:hypothetical protein